MPRIVVRLAADTALVAFLLFLSAGTLTWSRGWLLLAVMLMIRAVGALVVYRINPGLMEERAKLPFHEDQAWRDRVLLFGVLATGFVGLPIIAGLDAFRWHLLPSPPEAVSAMGLMMFASGWCLKSLALRANAFAIPVVRVQTERAHAVADAGVYSVVRHPFYAADPLIFAGLGLWLESYVAVFSAAIPVALMIMRLRLEEKFLSRELPAYNEYMLRVPHRLIPGVW
jgi:protein-S-isoprenylcysteine O-methyltransferase Ste14